jgi:hypothetical protein
MGGRVVRWSVIEVRGDVGTNGRRFELLGSRVGVVQSHLCKYTQPDSAQNRNTRSNIARRLAYVSIWPAGAQVDEVEGAHGGTMDGGWRTARCIKPGAQIGQDVHLDA